MSHTGYRLVGKPRRNIRAWIVFTIISVISKRRDHRISPISTIDRCQKLKKVPERKQATGWTPRCRTPRVNRECPSEHVFHCRRHTRCRHISQLTQQTFRMTLFLVLVTIDICPTLHSQIAVTRWTRLSKAFV